jgi:hypothetical protein
MLLIASAMICETPRILGRRLILSAYDGIWAAVREIPPVLSPYVSDDLGNIDVRYGGFLQVKDVAIFTYLDQLNLFACFRLVDSELLEPLKVDPPAAERIYRRDTVRGCRHPSGSCKDVPSDYSETWLQLLIEIARTLNSPANLLLANAHDANLRIQKQPGVSHRSGAFGVENPPAFF